MIVQPAIGVDASYTSQNPLTLHSNVLVSNYTVLPESNLSINGTNYFIAKVNYRINFFSGDDVLFEPIHGLLTNASNSYTVENNYTLQTKVVEQYSYIKESEYIKSINLSELGVLNSFIGNFSAIASPIANYSYQILGFVNEIYTTKVTYASVNITLLQVLEEVDPELATAIQELKSISQTIYDLSQPLVYYGNEIFNILNRIEPELNNVVNGSALPDASINSNLLKLSADAVSYGNDSSEIYSLITSYQTQIQNFLSVPETGINVGNLPNLLASLDSAGSALIQEIHDLLASPFNSASMSTEIVSKQANEAVSVQNVTFENTYNSVKLEAAVPYLVEYLQFFIVSAVMIFIILIFSKRAKKNNANKYESKSNIASNLLVLGVTNFGATISILSLLYFFGFIPSFDILYNFFPMYGGVNQSTISVLSQSGSLSSVPITWLFFLMFSFFGALIFLWFSMVSHRSLGKSLQFYKTETVSTKVKTRAPVSTFVPGFLIVMEILLIIIFIENPKVFPDSITIFVVLVLFGYFIFSILFPFGIMSTGRRVRVLGNFAKNSLIKLAGSLYIAGIMLIYVVILFIASYLVYAYIQKNFPYLNIYINIITDFLFYLGMLFLLLASIILLSGSSGLRHHRTEIT